MRRLWCTVGLAGCAIGSPDRVDPFDFPAALSDSDVFFEPNNCATRAWPFEANATGWVSGVWDGVGDYIFQSTPEPVTQIQLTTCRGGLSPEVFTLTYFGTGRVEPGEYRVSMFANTDDPAFRFSYTESTRAGTELLRCDDLPRGRVYIDAIDARRVRGRFDVVARCVDEDTLSEQILPQETWFRGYFTAENAGRE